MMEKRNFVTSARTPMDGASDIDDIIDAGCAVVRRRPEMNSFAKKASAEDEKSDSPDGAE